MSFDPLDIIRHVQKDHPVIGDWRPFQKDWSPCVNSHSAVTWESELSQDCGFFIGCFKIYAH